jgi:parvulin-like peptidyl-prolyl isomerase
MSKTRTTVYYYVIIGFLTILLYSVVAGCGGPKHGEVSETLVVARVNGRNITAADVSRRMYPQGRPEGAVPDPKAVEAVTDQLVDRALILNWADKNKIKVDDETVNARLAMIKADYGARGFDKYIKSQGMNLEQFKSQVKDDLTVELAVEKAITSQIKISEADIVKYYEKDKGKYSPGKEYHIQQIIVENRVEAEEALTKLAFGADFEEIAAEVSLAPDRYAGGDVGYVPADALPSEVAEQLAVLPVGKVSPVVETEYGYFVVKLLDVREGEATPLSEVRDEIESELRAAAGEKKYAAWIGSLREGADVKIDKKALERI